MLYGDALVEADVKPSRQELLEELRKFEGRLPHDFVFDREEANSR
jgi:antitoxin MazE